MITGKTYRFHQGLNQWVRVACAVVLLSAASSVRAQVADSTDIPLTSIDNDGKSAVYTTTPQELQLQDNYRPRENDYLFTKKAWRRMSVGFGGGVNWITDNQDTQHQSTVHLNLTYRFNPVHALRFNVSSVQYHLAPDAVGNKDKAPAIGLGFDYLTNLTNFAGGYNPSRYVDISLVSGVGTRFAKKGYALGKGIYPYGKMGMQVDFNITKNVGLYVEPYVGLTKKMEQVLGNTIPERWNLFYGIQGGMKTTFEDTGKAFAKSDSTRRKMFFDTSIGWTSPNMNSDILTKSGVAYQVALGKWMNPILGFRLGVQGQSFFYSKDPVMLLNQPMTRRKEEVMLSTRAELMFDLPNAFTKWRELASGHNFDMNVLFGGEYGWIRKSHQPGDSNYPGFMNDYYGITSAMQFLYRINNPGTYIFVEPRYLGAFYKNQYESSGKHVRDDLYTISVGTRIYITNPSFRPVPRIDDYRNWWVAADLGGMKWQRSWNYTHGSKMAGINPSLSFSVGYDLARLASFRAQINYQNLSLTTNGAWHKNTDRTWGWGVWDNKYNVMDLRLSYMMNLNNLLQGYRDDRRYSLWWTIGPALTYIFGEKDNWLDGTNQDGVPMDEPTYNYEAARTVKGNVSPGIATSLMSVLALNKKIDLTVEAMGQYDFIRGTNPGYRGRINNVKYGLSVGTRYHFVPGELKSPLGDNRRMFFESSYGWNTPTFGSDFLHRSGHSYQLAIGKWINPIIGARIGATGQYFHHYYGEGIQYTEGMKIAREEVQLGGRAEVIFDPLNLFAGWRNKEEGHDFDLNLSAGAELGWSRRSRFDIDDKIGGFSSKYKGFTASSQLLYRVSNGTYVYLEPRYLRTNYKKTQANGNNYNNVYTLSVGTRVHMATQDIRRSHDEFTPGAWIGFSLGGMKWQRRSFVKQGGLGVNPSLTASLGYDLKKFASFRAQLDYQHFNYTYTLKYTGKNQSGKKQTSRGVWENDYDAMDLRLAYMLNINNLFQGYKADRKFNLWWTAGPAISYFFHEKNTWVKDQVTPMEEYTNMKVKDGASRKITTAVATSLMTQLQVSSQWDITCEALGQYNFRWRTMPAFRGRINNVKYDFSIGTRYHLRPGQLKSPLGDNRRMFFESSYGWNTPTFGSDFLHRSGHSYQLAIGKWINPIIGARIGATGQYFHHYYGEGTQYTEGMKIAREEIQLGGRAEVIFDPLNLFAEWRNKEEGHDFDLNLSAGAELGWSRRSRFDIDDKIGGFSSKYKGFTASSQLLYRISSGTYVYLEPRYLHTNYKKAQANGKNYNNVYTLSVGTRVHLATQDIRRSHDEFTPGAWIGFSLGGMKWQRRSFVKQGGLGVNPSLTASLGYDLKKFASFRAQLDYQHFNYTYTLKYTGKNQSGKKKTSRGVWENDYDAMDLRLAYMLNINNLFQGYKADRKFNLWWTAGPAISYFFHEKNTWVEDQVTPMEEYTNMKVKDGASRKITTAVATSIMTQLKIAPKWDITCEALGQYNFRWRTMPAFRGRINNVKYDFSIGTRYHF